MNIYYVMDIMVNYIIADRIAGTCSLYIRNIDGTVLYFKNLRFDEAKQIQSIILYLAQQARQKYGNTMPPMFLFYWIFWSSSSFIKYELI